MGLERFVDEIGTAEHAIAVVADDGPGPVARLLSDAFDDQPVEVDTNADPASLDDADPDIEAALDTEDSTAVLLERGTPVAASSLDRLYESILAINSDLFVTGARGLDEIELPDVLAGLEGTRLRLRGYPLAHKEKLLLIVVSRYVERLALEAGSGTLRSGIQQLSRIDDEVGTREAYERLASTDLSVHLYGVPDERPTDLPGTVHAGDSARYRDSWFVVFRPDDPSEEHAALVAVETEERLWDGFWTYDDETVAAIDEYVEETF